MFAWQAPSQTAFLKMPKHAFCRLRVRLRGAVTGLCSAIRAQASGLGPPLQTLSGWAI